MHLLWCCFEVCGWQEIACRENAWKSRAALDYRKAKTQSLLKISSNFLCEWEVAWRHQLAPKTESKDQSWLFELFINIFMELVNQNNNLKFS
jgi:hypothetical protein